MQFDKRIQFSNVSFNFSYSFDGNNQIHLEVLQPKWKIFQFLQQKTSENFESTYD